MFGHNLIRAIAEPLMPKRDMLYFDAMPIDMRFSAAIARLFDDVPECTIAWQRWPLRLLPFVAVSSPLGPSPPAAILTAL
jgi:hypothetical protein